MLYAFKLGRKLRGEEPYCPEKGGKGGSSDKSAKYAAEAQKYAADLQNQQWQTIMKNLAPFTPLAEQYVNQLQNLSSLEGQGQALNQYYNSQQYKDLAGQARYQSLAAAEATGGLGSTATSNQLATIAPTLGQQWLSGQMNNYNNLANIGLGALQGQANAGQTYANNMSQISQQSAALAAANANRPSALQQGVSGAASGALLGGGIASALELSTPWGAGIIDNVLTRANRLGKVANKDLIRGLSDLREELAKPDIDFGLLRELRSALRESIQGDAMVFPNSAKAATDAVERAMGADLRNNAARYLGAGEAARYVKANSDYSNVFNKVLNKRIANNLNKAKKEFTPELINSVVFSRKPSDIKRIWPALSEDGKNAMRAAYISKIAEKAGDSPTKFLTELNKLKSQSDGQIYNTIFSGRHMKELDALHEVLQQTARSDAANVVTQTGQSQANRIRTIGATATLGVSLGLEAGFGAIMRLYESKAARNALLRLANTKAGTPAYERAMNNAANAIRPLLATEATQQ